MKQAVLITILVAATMLVGWSVMAHAYAPVSGLPLFVMPGWKMFGAMFVATVIFSIPFAGGILWFSSLRDDRQGYLLAGVAITIAAFLLAILFRYHVGILLLGLGASFACVLMSRLKISPVISYRWQGAVMIFALLYGCKLYGSQLGDLPEEVGGQRSCYVIFEDTSNSGRIVFSTGNAAYVLTNGSTGFSVKLTSMDPIKESIRMSRNRTATHPPFWRIPIASP